MSAALHANHPLFLKLRKGLWHCTSPAEYCQIRTDGFIKPNDGRINKWGGCYACQELGAVSLFDFETSPQQTVLGELAKWQQFLGCARPFTVIIGIERIRLTGELIHYPQNKVGTTGNIIPWVEVCHRGPIPISAVTRHLLVCAIDYARFHEAGADLTDERLAAAAAEFGPLMASAESSAENQGKEFWQRISQAPEFQARMKLVKDRANAMRQGSRTPPKE